ncbi:MAG: hypothetical protein JKY70_20465 [Mucilaginibacter sp.]|nr:hypothetical protein [Mucilaginibacter sp.]
MFKKAIAADAQVFYEICAGKYFCNGQVSNKVKLVAGRVTVTNVYFMLRLIVFFAFAGVVYEESQQGVVIKTFADAAFFAKAVVFKRIGRMEAHQSIDEPCAK